MIVSAWPDALACTIYLFFSAAYWFFWKHRSAAVLVHCVTAYTTVYTKAVLNYCEALDEQLGLQVCSYNACTLLHKQGYVNGRLV